MQPDAQLAVEQLVLDLDDDLQAIVAAGQDLDVRGLEDLFKDAVKLDTIIKQQRPLYSLYPVLSKFPEPWTLYFSAGSMEINDDDGKKPLPDPKHLVKLVVAPGFWKYGNSAGRKYGEEISILRTKVEVAHRGK